MSWLRKITTLSLLFTVLGCGVKGDPLPPEKPAPLGRGRPTYRRASEEIKIEKHAPPPGPAMSSPEPEEQRDESE